MKIFTVFDVKAERYIQPFFSPTEGTAMREFRMAANDEDHSFCKYAEDYTLFLMGEWDDENGVIDMLVAMKPLGNALQFMQLELVEEGTG